MCGCCTCAPGTRAGNFLCKGGCWDRVPETDAGTDADTDTGTDAHADAGTDAHADADAPGDAARDTAPD